MKQEPEDRSQESGDKSRCKRRRLFCLPSPVSCLLIVVSCLLFSCPPAYALPGYVSARDLAAAHGLEYQDLSQGTMHGCKLVGNGREVLLFANLRNILIDGSAIRLTNPVQWDGKSIVVPAEAVDLFAGRFGKPAYTPPTARPARRRPAKWDFKVVIDPGHGGKDPGAVYGGLKEKDVNLDIARRLAAHLRSRGVTVVLTRRKDVYVSLSERVRISNKQQPDLFLSVHANAEVSRKQHGAMSLYPDDGPRDGRPGVFARAKLAARKRSLPLRSIGAGGPVGTAAMLAVTSATFESYRMRSIQAARLIQEALSPVTGCIPRANGIIEDFRGIRVLRGVQAPAVLVEVDFLSNRSSRRKLARTGYRAAIAEAIAGAVITFLKKTSADSEATL